MHIFKFLIRSGTRYPFHEGKPFMTGKSYKKGAERRRYCLLYWYTLKVLSYTQRPLRETLLGRGGKNLRDVLYMCSMNAIKTNPACKALYERLRANGKTGKQGLIAVCNKLLKQVFAVIKNNSLYQPNYYSAKP